MDLRQVIVVTRSYGNRSGIRYLTNGMKVYHMPTGEAVFPSGKVRYNCQHCQRCQHWTLTLQPFPPAPLPRQPPLSDPIGEQVSLPSLYGSFPVFRQIILRERIGIVHGHQASSVIGHECLMHAKTMGIPTCFTDHSLLGFADAASIHLNKVLVWSLCDIDHSICVSHTSKENTVLRAGVDPAKASTPHLLSL